MKGGTATGVRVTRLLGLAGLGLGFGLTTAFGGRLVARLAAIPVFGIFGKPLELAFLAVAGSGAALAAIAGIVAARIWPGRAADREAILLGVVTTAALADLLLPAGPALHGVAGILLLLGAVAVPACLAVPAANPRRTGGTGPLSTAVPDRPLAPGWKGWLVVGACLAWLQHDPLLLYRNIDQLHEGAHLAWASHIRAGILPGERLTLMYGPLYEYSLAGWMRVGGWTVVAERQYFTAAQVAGGVCAFAVLTRLCTTVPGVLAGLFLFHLLTPAGFACYGWANALRAGLGLSTLVAAIGVVLRGGGRAGGRDALSGAGLAAAFCYSPEAGGAALLGFLAVATVAGFTPGTVAPGLVARRVAGNLAGWFVAVGLVLTIFFAGPWPGRLESALHYSADHLAGFMAVPFPVPPSFTGWTLVGLNTYARHWSWIGWLAPAACAAGLVMCGAGWAAGQALRVRHWQLAGVGVYGLAALTTALDRSDFWHIIAAAPAGVLLAAAALERSVLLTRRLIDRLPRSTAGLRAAYLAALTLAWMGPIVFLGGDLPVALESHATIWGSKRAAALADCSLEMAGGWRQPFIHPRSGGLRLTRVQRDDLRDALAIIEKRTSPGEPIFAGIGAEAMYFLADRPCANASPVSLQAAGPSGMRHIVASLDRCRIAVVNRRFLVDGMGWEHWEPDVAAGLRQRFVPAWSGSELQVWRRR